MNGGEKDVRNILRQLLFPLLVSHAIHTCHPGCDSHSPAHTRQTYTQRQNDPPLILLRVKDLCTDCILNIDKGLCSPSSPLFHSKMTMADVDCSSEHDKKRERKREQDVKRVDPVLNADIEMMALLVKSRHCLELLHAVAVRFGE